MTDFTTLPIPTKKFTELASISSIVGTEEFSVIQGALSKRITAANFLAKAVPTNLIFIDAKADLPTPSVGVITLAANTTYHFTKTVDLTGDRLVAQSGTAIIGTSSENARILSTGLTSTALLTSAFALPMRNISIEADVAVALDATANANQAIDWIAVNFVDCGTVGTIKTYDNFIMTGSAFLNSGGLTFDGTIGTIAFGTVLFDNAATLTSVILPSTLTITRRFRVIYSAFVIGTGETGINASASATIPIEGYILDNVNFSGAGTFLAGVATTDNKARVDNCRGIDNSANIAQYFMNANTTLTTISGAGTHVKIAGVTTTGSFVERFDVTTTDNKAVYSGALTGFYKVTAVISAVSGNAKELSVRIARNGVEAVQSTAVSTTRINNKAEGIVCQDVVELDSTDFIEIFIANNTDATDITVEELNVIIERLN